MKYYQWPLFLLLGMGTSCTDDLVESAGGEVKRVVVSAPDFISEKDSRTSLEVTPQGVFFAWSVNDTLGIFPTEGTQVAFPVSTGVGTNKAIFSGGGWALKNSSSYSAYYPLQGKFYLDKTSIPVTFEGQHQKGNGTTGHIGAFDYMAAQSAAPENGNVNFDFKHLGCIVMMQLPIAATDTLHRVTLSVEDGAFVKKGKVDLTQHPIHIAPVEESKNLSFTVENVAGMEKGKQVTATLYFMMAPTHLQDKHISILCEKNHGERQYFHTFGKDYQEGRAYRMMGSATLNGSYNVAQPGQLSSLVSGLKDQLTQIKVTGYLNGDDILCLREMAGRDQHGNATKGSLVDLDLSGAHIVNGGTAYYISGDRDWAVPRGTRFNTKANVIGDYMFAHTNLSKISYPAHVRELGNSAFYETRLREAVIPSSVSRIGERAFMYCTDLEEIHLPETVKNVGQMAFAYTGKAKAYVDCEIKGNGGTHPSASVFFRSELASLKLGRHVQTIEDYTYNEMFELQELSFEAGNQLQKLGFGGLGGMTKLKVMPVPRSLTELSELGYAYLPALTRYEEVGDGSGCCRVENDILYVEKDGQRTLFSYPAAKAGEQFDVEGVAVIARQAFRENQHLKQITLGAEIQKINQQAFSDAHQLETLVLNLDPAVVWDLTDAFMGCKALKKFKGSCASADEKCIVMNRGLVKYVTAAPETAYAVPAGVDILRQGAFYDVTHLKQLTVGGTVATIEDGAIKTCPALEEVILGTQVQTVGVIGESCDHLQRVTCQAVVPPVVEKYLDLPYSCVIYVPVGSKEAYRNAPGWSQYEIRTIGE